MSDCDICQRPILDTAYVDSRCAAGVAKVLMAQADNWAELDITIARITAAGEATRGGGATSPLPYDPRAATNRDTIRNTITTWARHVESERGWTAPADPGQMMRWLARQCDWLRYRREAAEVFEELRYAATLIAKTVDSPPPLWYAGRCGEGDCQEDLYGRTGAPIVRCRGCGAEWDAAKRREWLLGLAEDRLATATECARFVSAMIGDMVTASMVRGYALRGRIVQRGVDRDGRPTYRVGDLLDTLERITV